MRKEAASDDLPIKQLSKYYGLDVISKVLFAMDVDSYKERDTIYVKSAIHIGDLNTIQAILATVLPKGLAKILRLSIFDLKPMNNLGHHFKKMLKKRRENGIKYNDLSELLQDAVDENKIKLSEDGVIGNILLAFFGKF